MSRPRKNIPYKTSSFYVARNTTGTSKDEDKDDDHSHSQPLESSSYLPPRSRLMQFLDAPQQPFVASQAGTRSTKSRKPRFFDLHLHPDLRLRKIVVVEDLPERVATVCNDFLDTHILHIGTSTPFPFDVPVEDAPRTALEGPPLRNESALGLSYQDNFGLPLSMVTSTLIFKRPNWEGVLDYSLHPRESGKDFNFAIPDSFLCITREHGKDALRIIKSLQEDEKADIETIKKHNLHHIALWEFKNLVAGSKKTMDKFVELEGDFTWPCCDRRLKQTCDDIRHDHDGKLHVTGRKIGFDSRHVEIVSDIYSLPAQGGNNKSMVHPGAGSSSSTTDTATDAPMDVEEEETSDSDMAEDISFESVMPSIPEEEMEDLSVSVEAAIASNKTLDKPKPAARSSLSIASTSVAGKRRGGAPRSSRIHTANARAKKGNAKVSVKKARRKKQPSQKPRDIAVQLWSQCVKYDVTFIILNAGNYEIIFVRCRATNTFYISRVVSVQEKIYKRAQIGLQALAFDDARDRAYQLEALQEATNPIFPSSYYLTIHSDPYPPIHEDASKLSSTSDDATLVYNNLLTDLKSKAKFNLMLSNITGKDKKYDLCTLFRQSPSVSEVSAWSLELADKLTERVYSVVARNNDSSFSDKLVIKLAETTYELRHLKYECETHLRFEKEDFGIEAFGIIEVPDSSIRGLLMKRSGYSPDELWKKKKLLVKKNRENYIRAIQRLHAHNFLHGHLKFGHFLMTDEGHVSLISYKATQRASHFDLNNDNEALAKEFADQVKDEEEVAKRLCDSMGL